jgi:hypothetical protein
VRSSPRYAGRGLRPLMSCEMVTERHGRTIETASEEGAFSHFTIRLLRR